MRVLFSKTVRAHMRDSSLYTSDKTWTPEENEIAEACLAALRANPYASDDEVISSVWGGHWDVTAVWQKLQTFPHMFEVYAARGDDLMRYDLHGEIRNTIGQETKITQLSYRRWNVALADFDALLEKGVLEPSTWELLAGVLRASLPSDVLLRQPHLLRTKNWNGAPATFSEESTSPNIPVPIKPKTVGDVCRDLG